MGYQTIGQEGSVTSWGTGAANCKHLIDTGMGVNSARLTMQTDELNTTASGDTAQRRKTGLRSWTVELRGLFPKTTRKIGNTGLVTYASGYATYVNQWSMQIQADVLDITAFGQADVTTKVYRPGRLLITGSYEAMMDSAANPINASNPGIPTTSSAAATFKATEEGGTDNEFTGNILTTQADVNIPIGEGGLNTASYNWILDGALTVVGSANVLPAGVLSGFDWDTSGDGVPDQTLLFQSSSGRTYSGVAFLSSLQISVNPQGLIEVTATAQGAGPLTVA